MKKSILLILILVVFGVLSRTVFHLGANIEFVTAIGIVSGIVISNKKLALTVPVLIMFISDLFIGNTNIFIFTWSGFILPVVIGFLLKKVFTKTSAHNLTKLFIFSELAGIGSSLFFFIWSNLGHFLTTNMYQKDLSGLISCYINAIPFLKPQLAGNLIIVPVFVLITFFALKYSAKLKLNFLQK